MQGNSFNMATAMPMFIIWISIICFSLVLVLKSIKKKSISIVILILSIGLGGILLGAIPNAILPILQILTVFGGKIPIVSVIPMVVILGILLLSTFLIGRMFCGYSCPMGALQELASKLNFKSSIKEQKKTKLAIKTSQKIANIIRWSFFLIFVIISVVWGLSIVQIINPFSGFKVFTNPFSVALLIPLISIIVITILSFFIYRPWCRYLCPFGAVSTLTSRYSIYTLSRTDDCNECGLCEKICPTQEAFSDSKKGECYYCNRCVDICPNDAIKLKKK